jgi:hypothetical protein
MAGQPASDASKQAAKTPESDQTCRTIRIVATSSAAC